MVCCGTSLWPCNGFVIIFIVNIMGPPPRSLCIIFASSTSTWEFITESWHLPPSEACPQAWAPSCLHEELKHASIYIPPCTPQDACSQWLIDMNSKAQLLILQVSFNSPAPHGWSWGWDLSPSCLSALWEISGRLIGRATREAASHQRAPPPQILSGSRPAPHQQSCFTLRDQVFWNNGLPRAPRCGSKIHRRTLPTDLVCLSKAKDLCTTLGHRGGPNNDWVWSSCDADWWAVGMGLSWFKASKAVSFPLLSDWRWP